MLKFLSDEFGNVIGFFAFLVVVSLVSLGIYALVRCMFADGKVNYCYIEMDRNDHIPFFKLRGHKNWRDDLDLGRYPSLKDAVDASQLIQCKLSTISN